MEHHLVYCLIILLSLFFIVRCYEDDDVEVTSNSLDVPVVDDLQIMLEDYRKRGISGSRLTYEERIQFLNAHNDFRRNVDPSASNMQFMVWNEELAVMAQQWADKCVWKHGNPQHNPQPFSYIGQNIHATTASSVTGRSVTTSWHNEIKHYTYQTNSCAENKVCGHYKQVVWAKSSNLGCAIANCPQLTGTKMKNAKFTVCNYGPGGNYVGEQPYWEGRACSSCPSELRCGSDMCVQRPKCGPKTCANGGSLNMGTCECRCPTNYDGATCTMRSTGNNRGKRQGQETRLLYAIIRGLYNTLQRENN